MESLVNPLQALIARAAKTPAQTGAVADCQKRLDNAGQGVVILCDLSGSMAESAGGRTKIEQLQEALDSVLNAQPTAQVVGFNSTAFSLLGGRLPDPSGGTALHLGLEEVARHRPGKTVVISDGLPDSPEAALAAAERLAGIIDVIYCGPDSAAEAIEFMRRLARAGGGRVVVHDLRRAERPALGVAVRQLLALPAPTGGAS